MTGPDEMALVGRVARTHGLRGHVAIDVETDFPHERFRPGAEVWVARQGTLRRLGIVAVRFQQGRPIVRFEGIETATAAADLAGAELRVPLEWLAPLPAGRFYRHDLVGCQVDTSGGAPVGVVKAVEGAEDGSRLVVAASTGEILVPLAAEICRRIDVVRRRIEIDPPEGLLDLNVSSPRPGPARGR